MVQQEDMEVNLPYQGLEAEFWVKLVEIIAIIKTSLFFNFSNLFSILAISVLAKFFFVKS